MSVQRGLDHLQIVAPIKERTPHIQGPGVMARDDTYHELMSDLDWNKCIIEGQQCLKGEQRHLTADHFHCPPVV